MVRTCSEGWVFLEHSPADFNFLVEIISNLLLDDLEHISTCWDETP